MLETLQAWAAFTLVLMFGSILLASVFVLVGIKAAGLRKIVLRKAILVGTVSSVVVYFATLIFLVIPNFNPVLGFAIGNILNLFVIKTMLSGTTAQSFLLWTLNVMAHLLTVMIGGTLFIGSLRDLLTII